MEVLNEHMVEESKRKHKEELQRFYRVKVDWLSRQSAYQQWQTLSGARGQQLDGMEEEEKDEYLDPVPDPGPAPDPPQHVAPPKFELPSIIAGFRLLRKVGLDRKGRAELLRSSRSMELSSLESVLRSSEAEHFTRSDGAMLAEEDGGALSGEDWAEWDTDPGEYSEGAWWGDWADGERITAELNQVGVLFERWATPGEIADDATQI